MILGNSEIFDIDIQYYWSLHAMRFAELFESFSKTVNGSYPYLSNDYSAQYPA